MEWSGKIANYRADQIPFQSMVRASAGLDEVWTHVHEGDKFGQFGWRCWTNENSYCTDTLIGNWNEERFDIKYLKKGKPLPSDKSHYYQPTYSVSYNKPTLGNIPVQLRHLKRRFPASFPGHQSEFDPPRIRDTYDSWETTSRVSYIDPAARMAPGGVVQSRYKPISSAPCQVAKRDPPTGCGHPPTTTLEDHLGPPTLEATRNTVTLPPIKQ